MLKQLQLLNMHLSKLCHCYRQEYQVQLEYVPPIKEMEKALASRFIMTMASSPPDQPSIKTFFYAQHVSCVCVCVCVCVCISVCLVYIHLMITMLQVSTLHIFLMEVNLTMASATLSFILKCENPIQAPNFIKHFLQTLVSNRWLSKH